MDKENIITFSQSDLPYNSFISLEDMRRRGHLCDLKVKVQKHSISAHRVILAAGIPYFANTFANSTVETGETEIAVEELDPQALESLIHFAYTNEIKISIKNAEALLVASQFLKLNQVRDACVEFLSERLRVDNVWRLRVLACSLNTVALVESCDHFIRNNFEQFMKCDDFVSLSPTCIKEIISDDDLNISSEEVLFEAVMKWVKASPGERPAALPELLCEVRMVYLPIHYVIDRVDSEEFIISSKPCRDLVNEVKSYHLLTDRRTKFPNLKKRPRNRCNFGLYAICSCDTCGYSAHHFDFAKEVWRILASNKTKSESIYAVVAVNGIIYMFLHTNIQTFHPKTARWKVLESTHDNLDGAAIVSNGNYIYCFGSDDTICEEKVRCFDTLLNEWLQEERVNTVRYGHSAASLGDTVYVTGGYSNDRTLISPVEKYCTVTGKWSDIAPMLNLRFNHRCCGMNGKVYVCGGNCCLFTPLSTVEVYDPQTDQWNFVSHMKNPEPLVSLVSQFNKLYAVSESNIEVYDPKFNAWGCSFSVPGGFRHAVTVSGAMPNKYRSNLSDSQSESELVSQSESELVSQSESELVSQSENKLDASCAEFCFKFRDLNPGTITED